MNLRDLHHDAVDRVIEIASRLLDAISELHHFYEIRCQRPHRIYWHTPVLNVLERIGLRRNRQGTRIRTGHLDLVPEEAEWPVRSDARVEHAQTAGGGVTRVGKG